MTFMMRQILALLLAAALAGPSLAGAEERSTPIRDQVPATTEPRPTDHASTKTGKERLGEKWTDNQRLNNCKVPAEKRGEKPRPGDCSHSPTS